jgi:hypothetical protein
MTFAKKQTGMSLITTLVMLGFVVFLAYLTIMIVPVYIDDYQAQKIVGNLDEKEADFFSLSKQDIIDSVDRRFSISSIYDIKPREVLKIKTGGGKVKVQMHYDREIGIAANLFVVMKFRHDYEFSK